MYVVTTIVGDIVLSAQPIAKTVGLTIVNVTTSDSHKILSYKWLY